MNPITRSLVLPAKHSVFLFGPRQVGKTRLILDSLKPDLLINLLENEEFLRYAKDPALLNREIEQIEKINPLVVIDEIQRLPELLNAVQACMGKRQRARFVLTGSSARKLKRKGVNLLGGRALVMKLHPFTHEELGRFFSLEGILRFGSLPPVATEPDKIMKAKILQTYVEINLKEEIQNEALTRRVAAFARFLDLAAFENGNILNFSRLSQEIGMDAKTIRTYFEILEDTLIGFFLLPYTRSHRAKLVKHPKFIFFDPGIVSALQKTLHQDLLPASPPYGRAFEHWIILEIRRLLDYREREYEMFFFRTTDGAEVDLILKREGELWAIEIKSSRAPRLVDLSGIRSFTRDHHPKRAICVCQTPRPYQQEGVEFLPWRNFMALL